MAQHGTALPCALHDPSYQKQNLHGFLVDIYADLNDCLFGISVGINLFKNDFRRFSEGIFWPPL